MSLATETSNKDLIVDLDKVETAVVGDEGGDLLAVLQQLHTDALTDGRVGLLGLDTTKKMISITALKKGNVEAVM